MKVPFALGILHTPVGKYALRMADVTTATDLTTAYDGDIPSGKTWGNAGAIVLGVGGDNSNNSCGNLLRRRRHQRLAVERHRPPRHEEHPGRRVQEVVRYRVDPAAGRSAAVIGDIPAMTRNWVLSAFLVSALGVLTVPAARAAQLQQVSGWTGGTSFPSDVTMYIYVPDKVATNPPILVLSHYCGGTAQHVFGQAQGTGH